MQPRRLPFLFFFCGFVGPRPSNLMISIGHEKGFSKRRLCPASALHLHPPPPPMVFPFSRRKEPFSFGRDPADSDFM